MEIPAHFRVLAASIFLATLAGCQTASPSCRPAVSQPAVNADLPDAPVGLASHESAPLVARDAALTLTLDEAIAVALDRNPNLVALRSGEGVAQAACRVAGTYPWNPYVQVEVLPYTRDREGDFGSVAHYVLLMQTLELAHQRQHRQAAAEAASTQVRWNIVQAELSSAAQTQRLYCAALYQRELRDLAQRTASLHEDLLGIVERRFQAALATAAEQTTARVTARQSRKQAALAEANFQSAMLALRRQLNLSAGEPFSLAGRLEDFHWLPVASERTASSDDLLLIQVPDDFVATLAEGRPDVIAAQADVNTAAANVDLARANRIPNVAVGPFYERDDVGTVFAGFRTQMDLPVWNNGCPLVQQREAELQQRWTSLEQLRARAKVEAQTAIERYERARRLAERERTGALPSIPDELQRIKEQFAAGQADILNVFAAQTALFQERRAYLDLLNELAQAAADVTLAAALPPAQLIAPSPEPLPQPQARPTP